VLAAKALEKVTEHLHDLPVMPCVVQEVMVAANDPSADMTHIATLIERDPALTARILRISNSPYYGMRQQVGTLRLALVILGIREIRNIVIGIAALDAACGGETQGPQVEAVWRHSVAVGAFSKKLGACLGYRHQGEDFIAGLLHDIGKVIMLRHFGPAYSAVQEHSGGNACVLSEREETEFGFDHADAAAALASKWNLPVTLADAICCHHGRPDRPFSDARDPSLAALVWVADRCVGRGAEPLDAAAAAANISAWTILDQAPQPLAREERRDRLAAIAEDLNLLSPLDCSVSSAKRAAG
jgi:HD-like signal output (HDOD) protein